MTKKEQSSKINSLSKVEKLEIEAQKIVKQFQACENFKSGKNIVREANRSIEFYEGRQWGEYKGKNIPFEKPVLNVCATIVDGKVASVNQKNFHIEFVVDDDNASTNKVTKFAEFQMKEMKQDELNLQASYDAYIKGTWCWFFYWDEDATGPMGTVEGSLKCSMVDVKDIAVANPNERDLDKQEWIIIRSRESVKFVKEQCNTLSKEEIDEYIEKKDYNSPYKSDSEQIYDDMCNSYIKFFKKDGEVYFEKCTDDIVYQKATSMNPMINKQILELTAKKNEKAVGEANQEVHTADAQNNSTMTKPEDTSIDMNEIIQSKYKASIYPLVIESYERRNNCIFGRSLVYGIIPMQKIINQLVATNTLAGIKSIMPTIVAKQGALGTSDLDLSKPGGLVIDRSVGQQGFGIQVLNAGTLSNAHFTLAQDFISATKDIYRATDILDDGRNISKDLSGYAMSQLQTIQAKPIAQHQEILSRAIAREGRILEMFYKLYYRDKAFSYEFTDAELMQQNPNGDINTMARSTTDIFDGSEYLDTPFNITVEVGETAKQSELMLTSQLETLFLNGTISKLDPQDLMMWSELVPSYAFPKKREFKQLLKQKENSIISQLQAQVQQLAQQNQQQALNMQALQQEFATKINQSNENLRQMSLDAKNMYNKFKGNEASNKKESSTAQ